MKFIVAITLTIAMFGFLGWGAYHSYAQARLFKEQDLRVEELRGMIVYLDEALTMSVRLAVLTGENRWEERYTDFKPALDAALREATHLAEGIDGAQAAIDTNHAYRQLVLLNQQALDLLHQGRADEARTLLFGHHYIDLKAAYGVGMKKLVQHLKDNLIYRLEVIQNYANVSLLIVVLAMIFDAYLWRAAVRTLRQWRDALVRSMADQDRAEAALRQLNAELEERVAQRTELLQAANKELEAFSYSVSHDLRAPLRAIDGFSRILLEDHGAALDEGGHELLGSMRDNTQRMGQLIDDLLAFSRLGRQVLKRQPVEPGAIVDQCLRELQGEKDGRQVQIEVGELPECQGDPSLLKQVWINLISNALKYTRRQPEARIEIGCRAARENPAASVYYVKDNGVGFDMRYIDKLFGVFSRLHRAEDYEGTGVGLAIVRRIIDRHGGRIWAESQPNQGATFYFMFGKEVSCE